MTPLSWYRAGEIIFLNPRTCGIYKDGGPRYKVDETGKRTAQIDNELLDHVEMLLAGQAPPGAMRVPETDCLRRGILVPNYYDPRWDEEFAELTIAYGLDAITLGELEDRGVICVTGGHGSPSQDQRVFGEIPYIKVSDIRGLRINPNPTNFLPRALAKDFWGGGWDLITPNRASSNIGEFALLLPGEEEIVLTKEVFVIRVVTKDSRGWDPFYLLWTFCLRAVRNQWRRVALMQTNREDVADRYKEIRVLVPKDDAWAHEVSAPFRDYFMTLATARERFVRAIDKSGFTYIPNLMNVTATSETIDAAEEQSRPASSHG